MPADPISLAASLLGIASFGIQLTTALYKFGSTVSSAQQQTDKIARHIRLYSEVLKLLAQRIKEDEPVHSPKALDLVGRMYNESWALFESIQEILPENSDKISFLQKVKWNFTKTKADQLISEIDYLRSTVSLLVNILYAGKKVRTYRRRKLSRRTRTEVDSQLARDQDAIVEQMEATALKEEPQTTAQTGEQDEFIQIESTKTGQPTPTIPINAEQRIPSPVDYSTMIWFKEDSSYLAEEESFEPERVYRQPKPGTAKKQQDEDESTTRYNKAQKRSAELEGILKPVKKNKPSKSGSGPWRPSFGDTDTPQRRHFELYDDGNSDSEIEIRPCDSASNIGAGEGDNGIRPLDSVNNIGNRGNSRCQRASEQPKTVVELVELQSTLDENAPLLPLSLTPPRNLEFQKRSRRSAMSPAPPPWNRGMKKRRRGASLSPSPPPPPPPPKPANLYMKGPHSLTHSEIEEFQAMARRALLEYRRERTARV